MDEAHIFRPQHHSDAVIVGRQDSLDCGDDVLCCHGAVDSQWCRFWDRFRCSGEVRSCTIYCPSEVSGGRLVWSPGGLVRDWDPVEIDHRREESGYKLCRTFGLTIMLVIDNQARDQSRAHTASSCDCKSMTLPLSDSSGSGSAPRRSGRKLKSLSAGASRSLESRRCVTVM